MLIRYLINMNPSYIKRSAITISAFALNSAFIYPQQLFWQAFLFLIPIFYYGIHRTSLTFLDGFCWGIIYNAMHFLEIFVLLKKYNGLTVTVACFFLFIVYCSLYAGIWFFIATLLSSRCNSQWYKSGVWVAITWFYFFFVRFYLFWMVGVGDCFTSPILPLAQYPPMLRLLPILGSDILLLSLIVCAQLFTAGVITKNIWFLQGALFFLLPFCLGGAYQYPVPVVAPWLYGVGYVAPLAEYTEYPLDDAQEINYRIMRFLSEHPHKKIVIMPEESYPYPLNTLPEIVALWRQNALASGIKLLLGSHKMISENLFNSLYCIDQAGAGVLYDKRRLVPFYEYIPTPDAVFGWGRQLFLKNKKEFSSKNQLPVAVAVDENCYVMPSICSDFYFSADCSAASVLLCMVNDGWCYFSAVRHCMYLFVRYQAIELQNPCIYIGHRRGMIIMGDGSLRDCAL